MSVAVSILLKLTEALSPEDVRVIDESLWNAGDAGARPEGETHFRVKVVATAFAGLSEIERHRLVIRLLADEVAGPVHTLSLTTLTPDEAAGR